MNFINKLIKTINFIILLFIGALLVSLIFFNNSRFEFTIKKI